jgi:galactonate dehydratase
MRRRQLLQGAAAALFAGGARAGKPQLDCGCAFQMPMRGQSPAAAFEKVGSKLRVTGMKVFGVSLSPNSDRPYVFVKLETNQGIVGWGEGTLEGKAGAVIACVNDFHDFVVGADPMQVEHIWQSMYVHSFYRPGPVMGSAISGIDQALWDIRGKALGMPVYKLLGGPLDSRGVRGYYHADGVRTPDQLKELRATAIEQGVSCFKTGPSGYFEWIDTNAKITQTVKQLTALREGLGPDIDIAVDFHAKTSPTVASVIIKELEPINLLFVEEPCPPENVKAMARIARRSTVPLATGERLVAHYGVRELIEMGVVDVIQVDINHVGGISAVWKAGAMAEAAGITMAPHACEGPIGGVATLHVDAAMPNFLVQEICGGVRPSQNDKIWEEWLGFPAMRMVNGRFPLPEKPGLGFDLTEAALAKYPFGGTRPMGRPFAPDGSVVEW